MRKNDLYKYYDESIVYKMNISIELETIEIHRGGKKLFSSY